MLKGERAFDGYQKGVDDAMSIGSVSALLRQSFSFTQLIVRQSIRGQLVGTVPAPPHVHVPTVILEPEGEWVAEMMSKPAGRFDLGLVTTESTKIARIISIPREWLRAADDRALGLLERFTLRALRSSEDRKLLSADAAVANERPAGLLYGLSPLGGGSPPSLDDDLRAVWDNVRGGDAVRPHYIVSPRGGMYLATLRTTDGNPVFPNIGPLGGELFGVPVIASKAATNHLILIDAASLVVVDDGVLVDVSENAAIQMDEAPGAGPAELVSAWQTDSVFLKFERFVFWLLMDSDAVAFLDLPIDGSPA